MSVSPFDDVSSGPVGSAVAIRSIAPGAIWMVGEFDISKADDLQNALNHVLSETFTEVTVDISAVTFIDASTIHVLTAAYRAAHRRGVEFRISGPSAHVSRVLDVCGVLVMLVGEDGTTR